VAVQYVVKGPFPDSAAKLVLFDHLVGVKLFDLPSSCVHAQKTPPSFLAKSNFGFLRAGDFDAGW
jgi:hypothetical protein